MIRKDISVSLLDEFQTEKNPQISFGISDIRHAVDLFIR
jgi:hypothetical protein